MEDAASRDLTPGQRARLLRTPLSRSRASSRARYENKLWKKYFFTIPTFLFFLTCFQLVNLLTLTYTDSVLNYISKRFVIPYTMASFIPSSYMIGSMIAVVPISYFGVSWNKPRAISIGVMVMICGLGLCILPHFIMNRYHVEKSNRTYLCKKSNINHALIVNNMPTLELETLVDNSKLMIETRDSWDEFVKTYHSSDKVIRASLSTPKELPCNKNSTTYNPSVLLIIGHILIGGGASPLWPLGIAYLDDHVLSRKMPVYLGVFIGTTLTGPVAGFLLGSVSSAIYVTMDKNQLTPKDPRWIGAWWLGYVIAGVLLILLLLPFCFFPKSLPISDEKKMEKLKLLLEKQKLEGNGQEEEDEMNEVFSDEDGATSSVHSERSSLLEKHMPTSKIKNALNGLVDATKDILSRPVAVCCIFAYTALANLLSGVSTYGSTYIQMEFNVLRITSDMLIGGVCVPFAILCTFGGGFVIKRFDFDVKRIISFNIMMSGIGMVFFMSLYPIGCNLPKTAGINYPTSTTHTLHPTLNQTCNIGCNCTKGLVKLICGNDKITYIAPCYAGCTSRTAHTAGLKTSYTYNNCSCVNSAVKSAKLGPCAVKNCTENLILFMFVCVIGICALCFCQAPSYAALLRVLADANKPYGIGIMTVVSRLLGYIPAPIWFGALIDDSCIYWGQRCKGKALCKLYNNSGLRIRFVSACIMCGLIYTTIYILTYFCITWRKGSNDTMSPSLAKNRKK